VASRTKTRVIPENRSRHGTESARKPQASASKWGRRIIK
jgi:hypothetical protein